MNILPERPAALAAVMNELVESHLRAGQAIRFEVPTTSMVPTLSPGDKTIVRRANPEALRLGDIVVQKAGGVWRAHRLIGRRYDGGALFFITKGDCCPNADEAWSAAQLTGVVETVERAGRRYDVRSSRVRWVGALVARLSRAQWLATRAPCGFLRRVSIKASGRLMLATATLAWRITG